LPTEAPDRASARSRRAAVRCPSAWSQAPAPEPESQSSAQGRRPRKPARARRRQALGRKALFAAVCALPKDPEPGWYRRNGFGSRGAQSGGDGPASLAATRVYTGSRGRVAQLVEQGNFSSRGRRFEPGAAYYTRIRRQCVRRDVRTTSSDAFTHYSLLRTTEQMLGIRTYLGRASSARSMRGPFHI
jgi:hypothetical protein